MAKTGSNPPKELSEDSVSIPFDGLMWYPKPDLYKLNIQSLQFSKKKRGRFPTDLIKLEDSGKTVEDYVPDQITRTNCTSVVAFIWDTQGLLAPLTLKLKHDL